MDMGLSALMPKFATAAKIMGGVVLGLLYDALVELIFDPTGKKLRAAFRAGHTAGVAQMAEQASAAVKMRLAQDGRDAMLLEELRQAAQLAPTARWGTFGGGYDPGRERLLERARDNTPRFERTAATGGVRLTFTPKLTEADGAIFVDWYIYRLEGTRHDAKGSPLSAERLNDAKVPTRIWTDSPT